MAILIYQLLIASIILFSALFSRRALYRASATLSMWTLTHLFMPWLMALQFGTITVAFIVGLVISKLTTRRA